MKLLSALACLALAATAGAQQILVNQTPAANGGTLRWSKLWVDPTGQNDLDGDAICYEDFVLSSPATINHLEWWGDAVPNQGFQLEIWRQDPGTIAYQPIAVFRETTAHPEWAVTTKVFNWESTADGIVHYSFDLTTPVELAANDANNPRWFLAVIGLTDVPFLEWSWAQGLGGSTRTFQWVRQSAGPQFRVLGEGRAMVIAGPVPEPATIAVIGIGVVMLLRRRHRS